MPEIRYYTVAQTRVVRVRANNATDATIIARVAFRDGQDANGSIKNKPMPYHDVHGDTVSHVTEVGLDTALER